MLSRRTPTVQINLILIEFSDRPCIGKGTGVSRKKRPRLGQPPYSAGVSLLKDFFVSIDLDTSIAQDCGGRWGFNLGLNGPDHLSQSQVAHNSSSI